VILLNTQGAILKKIFVLITFFMILISISARAETGKLKAVFVKDLYPFSMEGKDGKPEGLFIDVLKLLEKEVGMDFEYIPKTFPEAIKAVKNGDADLHAGLLYTPQRAKSIYFSRPYYTVQTAVFYDKNKGAFDSIEESGFKSVAMVKNTFNKEFISEHFPYLVLHVYKSYSELADAAARGKVEAAVGAIPVLSAHLSRLGVRDRFRTMKRGINEKKVYFGVKSGNSKLLTIINRGLSKITNDELAEIEAKWVVSAESRYYKKSEQLNLTIEEIEWIKNHKNITLGFGRAFPPFQFMTDMEEFKGMAADYVALLNKKLGINIEPVKNISWPEIIEKARKKKIDGLGCAASSPARREFLNFSKPYISLNQAIVIRMGNGITNENDLVGKRVSVVNKLVNEEVLKKRFPKTVFVIAASTEEAIRFVSENKADAFVCNVPVAQYYINKNDYNNLEISGYTNLKKINLSFGIRKDWPLLLSILNKGIDSITMDEHFKIWNKWLTMRFPKENNHYKLIASLVGALIGAIVIIFILYSLKKRLKNQIESRNAAESALISAQTRLMEMMENAPIGVFRSSREGELIFCNRQTLDMMGYESVENATDSHKDLANSWYEDPADRQIMLNILKESGYLRNYEYRAKVSDNSIKWISMSARLADYDGEKIIEGFVIDITDQKKNERELKDSREKLEIVMGAAKLSLWEVNFANNTNIPPVNMLKEMGFREEEVPKSMEERKVLIHPDDWPLITRALQKHIRGIEDTYRAEFRHLNRSGEWVWIEDIGRIVEYDENGQPVKMIGISSNINERKQNEENLRQYADELEIAGKIADEANRAKSDFIASMSHEIRTPMNSILGMAEILAETSLDTKQTDYVNIIRSSGGNLLNLINDVLDISKVEAGELKVNKRPFNLLEQAEKITNMFYIRAHKKGVELMLSVKGDLPELVIGDHQRLGQVLVNLIDNSVKFTDTGHIIFEIKLEDINDGNCVIGFYVEDTGLGIPEDKLELIFDRFSQLEEHHGKQRTGTGLGLNISKRLIELMGGTIVVKSEVGKGSRFGFRLNMKMQKITLDKRLEIDLNKATVLVADRNRLSGSIAEENINRINGQVELVYTSDELKDALCKGDDDDELFYDVVIMDVDLMRENIKKHGGVCEKARKNYGSVVVMQNPLATEEEKDELKNLNFKLVNKPLMPTELYDIVVEIIHGIKKREMTKGEVKEALSINIKGKRILLVDDSDNNIIIVNKYLEPFEVILDVAHNGEDGFMMYKKGNGYDLVLMDIQMPVMDGYTSVRLIRKYEKDNGLAHVPVVAMTAHAMKEDIDKSVDAGCNTHLAKPVSKTALLEKIMEMFS